MIKVALITLLFLLGLSACQKDIVFQQNKPSSTPENPSKLPIAVSNNAVAYAQVNGKQQFYTFNGLTAGKTYQDITNQAFVWRMGQWQELNVPDTQLPVLASTAVTVGQNVYLFGGYTVAADHTEKSVPNVWQINTTSHQWHAMPAMPTPVDDTVALVYQDRYIYLISGWHDVDNVDLVQVFDTELKTWQQATPFPLPPVFGHAGGIVGNQILICDGVKVTWTGEKKSFSSSSACAIGQINVNDFTQIDWQNIPHHSGTAYYRMAAVGDVQEHIMFFGGSNNPYNYNGIGYNKIPAKPSNQLRTFDLKTQQWTVENIELSASMDHRGWLDTPQGLMILGGMKENQQVTADISIYKK